MIPTNRRHWTVLSIALLGLALAGCSSEPGRVAGLAGSPIPTAEAATTTSLGAHNHARTACGGGIQCERALETGFGPTP